MIIGTVDSVMTFRRIARDLCERMNVRRLPAKYRRPLRRWWRRVRKQPINVIARVQS